VIITEIVYHAWFTLHTQVAQLILILSLFYQQAARFTRGWLVLKLLCGFQVCMCVRTYHVHNNYITYIVVMRSYVSRLRQFRRLLCIAAMSSLSQLRLQDGYREAEATKTRQHKADREWKCHKQAAKY